jgi:sulfite exporter TauE/SafE
VNVSVKKAQAVVVSDGPLDMAQVAAAVGKAGYSLGADDRVWVSRDRQVWRDVLTAVAIAAVVAIAWQAFGLAGVSDGISRTATSGNLLFIALLGVAASLSTCMALVGGLVMALSARFAEAHPNAGRAQRVRPQAMFNLGRIVGFTVLGAVLGVFGQAVQLSGPLVGVLMVAVAVVMGLLGLKLTGVSPRLAGANLTLPPALTRWMFRDQSGERRYRDWHGVALGALSFFLPCGFTQAVQVYALSTGDPWQAGLVMGLFALGTTPGLMGVGVLSSVAKGHAATRVFRYVGVAVVAFAVINLTGALSLLGISPGVPSVSAAAVSQRTDNVIDDGGFQVARVTVASGYSPRDTVVYAGEPVKWVLEGSGFSCASIIDASSLGVKEYVTAQTAETTVEFTLPSPGTYRYSCAMGMYQGTFTAIDKPTTTPTTKETPK